MEFLDIDEHWEYENIELNLNKAGLGFSIKGGIDSSDLFGNHSIYISKLLIDGAAVADGRLQLGDIILSVNGIQLTDVMHFEAVDAIISAGNNVQLFVKRKKCLIYEQIPELPIVIDGILEIELIKENKGFGFSISGGIDNQHIKDDNGIYITKIVENGVAFIDGRIDVGDKLIAINDISLQEVTYDEAVNAVRLSPKKSLLTIVKKS
jgi:C-terminal processing protease CtpA/Prc